MTIAAPEAWKTLLDRARLELPEQSVNTWLAPLAASEFDGRKLVLTAPDQWSVEWNESKHTTILESFGPVCFGHPITVVFRVEQERVRRSQMDLFTPEYKATSAPVERQTGVISGVLNSRYTFDEFVVDRKSTRLNSSHEWISRMPSSA